MLPDVVKAYNNRQPQNLKLKSITKEATIADVFRQDRSTRELLSELHKVIHLYYTILFQCPMLPQREAFLPFVVWKRIYGPIYDPSSQHRAESRNLSSRTQAINQLTDRQMDLDVCMKFRFCQRQKKNILWQMETRIVYSLSVRIHVVVYLLHYQNTTDKNVGWLVDCGLH